MGELARGQGRASDVERGEVPEVAAVGIVLTKLFNTLGVTQSAYAHRVHRDKSSVSRYLSGSRLATQEFIDRLIQEVEAHAGAPLQSEVKAAVRQQRLAALAVINPSEYQLEVLREELERARRDWRRAQRQVEGLQLLLERTEREAEDRASEVSQLQLDWSAERRAAERDQLQLRGSAMAMPSQ